MPRASCCSKEEWAWLEERYPSTPAESLMDAFEAEFGHRPRTATVCAHMSDRGIRRNVNRIKWDEGRIAWFRAFVPGHTESEISAEHERIYGTPLTENQIGCAKTAFGVKSGTHGGRFEKGMAPHNKGRTWAEQGISQESQERMRGTCFKKGEVRDRPDGWIKRIGYERVNKDGYVEVKVMDSRIDGVQPKVPGQFNRNYRLKHQAVYEQVHGPIPRGCNVVFADGDRRNFDPENLVAVPRELWAVIARRGIEFWDKASLETAMNIARLDRARTSAMKAPRSCKRCGREFEPRYAKQRTCDACLGRRKE